MKLALVLCRMQYTRFCNRALSKVGRTKRQHRSKTWSPVVPRGATMAIGFQSDEEVLRNLRDKLGKMTDQELIRFGKEVRRLAENPFQRQLARAEKTNI